MNQDPLAPSSFTYSGSELEALSGAVRYYHWILRHFQPHLGKRVLEVGADQGTFSEYLLKETPLTQLSLIEPDRENFSKLRARYVDDPRVQVWQGFLEDHADSVQVDSVVAVNVIEHIEDDRRFLCSAHQVLGEKGTLLLFVPALTWLYGTIDQVHGHFRRYNKADLKKKIEEAGFKILNLSYFNFPGILNWFLVGRIFHLKTLRREQILFYDRWIVPWVSLLERLCKPPLGQSLVAIAQK